MTYQEKQAVVSAAAEKALRKIGATEHPNGQNNWQIGNTVISVHADAYANKVNIRPAALNDSRGKYYDGYRHNQRPESSLSIGPSLGSYLKRRAEEWADVYADYARALAAHNRAGRDRRDAGIYRISQEPERRRCVLPTRRSGARSWLRRIGHGSA